MTIDPRTVRLTLDSAPDGLELGLNSAPADPAPFTRTVIEGSQNTVIADSPQTLGGRELRIQLLVRWRRSRPQRHRRSGHDAERDVQRHHPPGSPRDHRHRPEFPLERQQPRGQGHDRRRLPDDGEAVHERIVLGLARRDGDAGTVRGRGITVAVPANATTQLAARTSDASGNDSTCSAAFPYIEDSTPPAAPAITDTDPDSPSSDNNPEVKGTTGAGSPTDGEALRERLVLGLAGGDRNADAVRGRRDHGRGARERDDPAHARVATDAAGNDSDLLGPFSYTEDSTRPAAPAITDTDPDSPSSDNDPEVKGTTGAGSPTSVELYANASCSGTPAATGTPAQFAAPGSRSRCPRTRRPSSRRGPRDAVRQRLRPAPARSPTPRTRRPRRPPRSPTPTRIPHRTTTTPRSGERPAPAPRPR